VSTCVNDGPRSLRSPSFSSWARSGNAATPAAKTSSTATSPKAASKTTDPPCHPAGFLDCCSPARTPSELIYKTTNACPEMNQLAALVRAFAQLLTPADDNGDRLEKWISTADEANLPHVHSFVRGL
jgi:hypothetical protein